MLGLGATKYWELVRGGEIEVVGSGAMSRAVYTSIKKYVAKLLAEAPHPCNHLIRRDGGDDLAS
jgi:hypothetical protein